MGYIYLITNNITKKQYVGQTKFDDDRRIKEHIYQAELGNKNLHLYNSIRKYGWENFTVTHLEDNVDECDLDKLEMYYIGLYDTFNNGYNNTIGGGGIRGYHHSEETKQKISDRHNPNIYTKERADKISLALKGRPKSKEHREKLSECAKQRTGEKNAFYGKHHNEKSIQANKIAHQRYRFFAYDLVSGKEFESFNNMDDVVTYIVLHKLSKAKPQSIKYRIYATIEGRQKEAYGYGWGVEEV